MTGCAAPAVRRELLRLDRVDTLLRERWAESKFADRALKRELDQLGCAALSWLSGVVDEHGWPGRALVGPRAASAAVRLVQHTEHDLAFRRRCLRLVRRAAARGNLPWHHVAYLTDALRVYTGRKQVYGTRFHDRDGVLVPLPIESAASVDQRRATLGLPSLEVYMQQLPAALPLIAVVAAAHARLCERRAWVLNEKRIVERAGLERVQPVFRQVPGNDGLLGWVADVEAALDDAARPTASGVRG